MGKVDTKTKVYMSVNERFADLFNNVLYHGDIVIKADELEPQDTTETLLLFQEKESEEVQKYRDILKRAIIKRDKRFCYVLLGIENQREYHLAMPVRNMLYDAIRYSNQVSELIKKNRGNFKSTKITSQEFLSGLRKEDKIIPIITITLYWNVEKWEAPQKLSEMLGDVDTSILKYFNDYDINLVQPSSFESFESFQTDLGKVLEVIKWSKDKEALIKLIETDSTFKALEMDTALLLKACTGMELEIQEIQGGKVDMCKAIEDLKEECIEKGREEGKACQLKDLIKKKLDKGKSIVQIAEDLEETPEVIERLCETMGE